MMTEIYIQAKNTLDALSKRRYANHDNSLIVADRKESDAITLPPDGIHVAKRDFNEMGETLNRMFYRKKKTQPIAVSPIRVVCEKKQSLRIDSSKCLP